MVDLPIRERIYLNVKVLVNEFCITLDDGQNVYERIFPDIKNGQPVVLDFSGVEVVAAPFLNAAIGQLAKDFEPDTLKDLLVRHLTGLEESGIDQDDIWFIIESSQRYYHDQAHRKAVDSVQAARANDPESW